MAYTHRLSGLLRDYELCKVIDYLREQVRVLLEHQDKENRQIPLSNSQRNCHAERFVKYVKPEFLDHLILSSVKHLEYVLRQYCEYYHDERIHQRLGRMIESTYMIDGTAEIVCIERLGGLLKSYHLLAA